MLAWSRTLVITTPGVEKGGEMEHRPHIVVVEDEATQRHLLVTYLTRQNFRVSGVDCGAALRKLVQREQPGGCGRVVHESALLW